MDPPWPTPGKVKGGPLHVVQIRILSSSFPAFSAAFCRCVGVRGMGAG
jgi:hypothetical protein